MLIMKIWYSIIIALIIQLLWQMIWTIGAAVGAGVSAVEYRVSTGSWKGAGKSMLKGAVSGAADGFMWGGITAGLSFTTVAVKGVKIKEIGKITGVNAKKGYPGIRYQNKSGVYRSIELHPNHNGPRYSSSKKYLVV